MPAWVSLAEFKNDQSLDSQATSRDDQALQRVLDAAMAFVQRWRPDLSFTSPQTVPADVRLGTLRLAAHLSVRGPVDLAELGARRSSALEPDIRTLLGIPVP